MHDNFRIDEDEDTVLYALSRSQWLARLSDGTTAYQLDKPGGVSGWLSLKAFLKETGLYIERVDLRFRQNLIRPVPPGMQGYFWRRMMGQFPNSSTFYFHLVGYLEGGLVHVGTWKCPELTPMGIETRDPASVELVGESLIERPS